MEGNRLPISTLQFRVEGLQSNLVYNLCARDSEGEEVVQQGRHMPEGYHAVTPYLTIADAAAAIAFYQRAFGAAELSRLEDHAGRIAWGEIEIDGSPIMLSDEYPENDILGPLSLGGTPVAIHLYVEDVDTVVDQAVASGAELLRPVADQVFGVRNGILRDPFGHQWFIATRTEDLTRDQMRARFAALISGEG
jgi:PhnB protein